MKKTPNKVSKTKEIKACEDEASNVKESNEKADKINAIKKKSAAKSPLLNQDAAKKTVSKQKTHTAKQILEQLSRDQESGRIESQEFEAGLSEENLADCLINNQPANPAFETAQDTNPGHSEFLQEQEEDYIEHATHAVSTASLLNQIEAVIFSSTVPLSTDKIIKLFDENPPSLGEVRAALDTLKAHYETRGVHLVEVASGWRFQVAADCAPTIVKTLTEKPSRLSRALLETLALIAYRQPITRAEIESIRGVVVSTHMVKTLMDHEWIRVVGHKDVPGKPALYATTKTFLDDMGLTKLDDLPPLAEIKSMLPEQPSTDTSTVTQSLTEITRHMAEQLPEQSAEPLPVQLQEGAEQDQEAAPSVSSPDGDETTELVEQYLADTLESDFIPNHPEAVTDDEQPES